MKYLFSDVDGTLMKNKNHTIDPNTVLKIKNFIASGNKFYMATGRTDNDIVFIEKSLGIKCDYRVSQNGTVITDKNDNIIYQSSIPVEILLSLKEYLYSLDNVRIEVSEPTKRYISSERPTGYNQELATNVIIKENLKDIIGVEVFPSLFLVLNPDESAFLPIKKYINDNFKDSLVAVLTSEGVLEILNQNSSKGTAIAFLQEKLNFSDNDVFVVGDNDNDISMFSKFKNSFVMKEAKYYVNKHTNFTVNQVGDVVDFIQNPTDCFTTTNKILVPLKNSIINEDSSIVNCAILTSNLELSVSFKDDGLFFPVLAFLEQEPKVDITKFSAVVFNPLKIDEKGIDHSLKGIYIDNITELKSYSESLQNGAFKFVVLNCINEHDEQNIVSIINDLTKLANLPVAIRISNNLYSKVSTLFSSHKLVHSIIVNESNLDVLAKLKSSLPVEP